MNRRILVLTLFFISWTFCLKAEEQSLQQDATAEIAGRVIVPTEIKSPGGSPQDTPTRLDIPAANAKVELVFQGDTLKAITNQVGQFSFKNLTAGLVQLSIDLPPYELFSESFELVPGENVVMVSIQREPETLDAAIVRDEMPVMTMRGDTLIYHAAAVALMEGDYAIDLLLRFPGVEVKNGQIIVTGKNVRRTYVNGALIFGLNPMDPMEYLKAEEVVTMNVYDEMDPEEKRDGIAREKQRVIDIITKNPIFSSLDLQVRALAGMDQQPREDNSAQLRYGAGTNAHFFSELNQMRVDIMTSNIGMRSSTIDMNPRPLSTYLDNTVLTLGYNHYWVSPLFGDALQTAYSFTHNLTRSRQHSLQDYFETAGIPERMQENENNATGKTQTHEMRVQYEYRTGKHVNLSGSHDMRFSRGIDDRSLSERISITQAATMLRKESSHADNHSWSLNEHLNIRFISDKPRPVISLSMNLGRDNLNSWELDTLASSYAKRYLTKAGNGLSQSYSASINQLLFNTRKMNDGEIRTYQLQGSYRISFSSQDKMQEAYDLYGTPTPIVNIANTYHFTYSSLANAIDMQFIARPENTLSVIAQLTARAERVADRERIPALDPYHKVFYSLLPTLSIAGRRLSFMLNSMTRTPAIEQLRRRIDDTHPLSLVAGNPALKQSVTYTVRLQNASVNRANKHVLTWSVSAQGETNPIVNKTLFYASDTILEDYDSYKVLAGSTLLHSENADFAYNLEANLMFSSQWGGKWKTTTRLSPSLSYQSRPQYFDTVLDQTTEFSPKLFFDGTTYPGKNLSFSFNTTAAYIHARNQAGSMDSHAFRVQASTSVRADFLKRAFFNGEYSLSLYRDLSYGNMRNDVHRLNLSLGVGLLKDKALKISIRGVDLLRGGSQYNVAVNPSSITQTWTPVYGRYFLIDISYRFNNSGGKILNLIL